MPVKPHILKKLNPGDPIEILWKDATTIAKWSAPEDAERMELAVILTRGTLVKVREDAVVVALDSALDNEGRINDHHSIGVVEIGSIHEIHRLRRERVKAPPLRKK